MSLKLLSRNLVILPLLLVSRAQANYDSSCMDLLVGDGLAPAMVEYDATWEPKFQTWLNISGNFSPLEFEAMMDWYRGLPLVATFDNGTKVSLLKGFTIENRKKMSSKLVDRQIVEVTYFSAALKTLGAIFKLACTILKREGCADAYTDYQGMNSLNARPLTMKEEQAVKWAAFYTLSPDSMAVTMKDAVGPRAESDVLELHHDVERWRTQIAREIIFARFSRADAEVLFNGYVGPTIAANFERVLSLFKGTKSN